MPRTITRREFVRRSAALTALATGPVLLPSLGRANQSANDRPLVGAIGLGGQGVTLARRASKFGDVVALCDVHEQHALRAKERVFLGAEVYTDYRRLLERSDIEAVFIATPDHWHTAIALAAMAAGKHVYVEKPLSLTVEEGQLLIAMARKTGRIVQVGTQQRGDQFQLFGRAVATVRSGRLGRLKRVVVQLPLSTEQGGPFSTQPVPKGLDWDFWLGQAPNVDYCPERSHVRYRWWYEYSGGIVTDWGSHHMDIVHWALDVEHSGPSVIDGTKTQLPAIPGGFNTPKLVSVDFRYPGDLLVSMLAQPPGLEGVTFEGEQGSILVGRGRITGSPIDEQEADSALKDQIMAEVEKLYRGNTRHLGDHVGNFFEAFQHGKWPVSDVESQHRSVTACHLANISIRLRRKLAWDATAERFVADDEANTMLSRAGRSPYQVPRAV